LKTLCHLLLFLLLTILTQIGGLVYLLALVLYPFLSSKLSKSITRITVKLSVLVALYTLATFVLVPMLAKPFGRVPLPVSEEANLKPLTFLTPFLNRHYVRPELKEVAWVAANRMNERFPGTNVNYLGCV
jgi:hypothetical protein